MEAQKKTDDAGCALRSRITLLVTIATSVFWLFTQSVDPYRFAVMGAFYEILWLPGLLLLWTLPVFSVIMLIREKFSFKSLYFYAMVISLLTFLQIVIIRN